MEKLPKILWKSRYGVGVQEIDEQHKKLVEILNELIAYASEYPGKQNRDIKPTLRKIIEYKTTHFETEEKYFSLFGFEGANEHIEAHREFDQKVSALISGLQKNSGKEKLLGLLDFMEDWFVDHLLNMDQKYVKCFKERGLT
jgi:hemerythrin